MAVLGDAVDLEHPGSPIIAGPFKERTYWPPDEGESGWEERFRGIARQRYDKDDCALLLSYHYNRVADDPEGLTFVGWAAKEGEILVVNSSEVRGVTGNPLGLKLVEMNPPKKRKPKKKLTHKKGSSQVTPPLFDPKQRLHLDQDVDAELRKSCKGVLLI